MYQLVTWDPKIQKIVIYKHEFVITVIVITEFDCSWKRKGNSDKA